jgi:hypothetical protein
MNRPRQAALRAAVLLACATLLGYTPRVSADWMEATPAVANYHNLAGNAEAVTGGGPLLHITGTIASNTDFDVYRISISNPSTFSASTVGTDGAFGDTQLFLFTTAGIGIAADDDSPGGGTLRSLLPAGNPLYASLAPGEYLLAISGYDRDPISAGGEIFPDTPFGTVNGPTGSGGGSPLSGQTDDSGTNTGTYTIDLTGAEALQNQAQNVPEPASIIVLGTAVVCVFGYRLRRNRQAA